MKAVVLISGNGSNLQSILNQAADIELDIRCVISNQAHAYGLKRAQKAGIATHLIKHTDFNSRASFDQTVSVLIDRYQPDIILLAGFMRILSGEFVQKYDGKMLNIHPSLLPKFQGLNTHQRALDAGETRHGASVHFVTQQLDNGAIIAQSSVAVRPDDDAQSLASRVLIEEHKLFPKVIHWFAQGKLKLINGKAILNGEIE